MENLFKPKVILLCVRLQEDIVEPNGKNTARCLEGTVRTQSGKPQGSDFLLSSGQLFLILHLCGRVQQPYSSCVSWYIVPASHRPTLCFSAPIQISRRGSLIRSAWARNLPMVWSSSCCWLMILSW